MSISFTKYVDITSGILAGGGVRDRELILRIYSNNSLIPTNSFAEFTSASQVALYFGSASTEYLMAAAYFAFISKTNTQPQKISFASWVNTATSPLAFGDPATTATLAALQAITSGALNLTIASVTEQLTGLNFASDVSLAAVAATLQTAIRAASTDADWTAATVAYNTTRQCFEITGGVVASTTTLPISVQASSGTDAGIALGFESVNAIFSFGSPVETLTNTMIASTEASSNFATFTFIPTLTTQNWTELATWLATENNMYMMLVPCTASNASALNTALIGYEGVAVTLAPNTASGDYPHIMPGMILAATDYTQPNVSQNFMFQQANFLPTVITDANSATYDALRVNYFGQTQTAGQFITFYQRGVLMGGTTAPTDMNIYANEIWFKSQIEADLLALLLTLTQISANNAGKAQIIATIQNDIQQALENGTISTGTILTALQIAAITNVTGAQNAWRQIQTIGYWLNVTFSSYVTTDGRTEYKANYVLVYKKNDAIRSIQGTHDLV